MRERLLYHLRGLPQIIDSWNRTEDSDSQPSIFARSVTKVTVINFVDYMVPFMHFLIDLFYIILLFPVEDG